MLFIPVVCLTDAPLNLFTAHILHIVRRFMGSFLQRGLPGKGNMTTLMEGSGTQIGIGGSGGAAGIGFKTADIVFFAKGLLYLFLEGEGPGGIPKAVPGDVVIDFGDESGAEIIDLFTEAV